MNVDRFDALRLYEGTAVSNNLHIVIIIIKKYKTLFLTIIQQMRQEFWV